MSSRAVRAPYLRMLAALMLLISGLAVAVPHAAAAANVITFLSPSGPLNIAPGGSNGDLKVQVVDSSNTPVAGDTVFFSYVVGNTAAPVAVSIPSPAGCSLGNGVTNASGILDCGPIASGPTPGTARFTATDGGSGSTATSSPVITVTGPPSKLVISGGNGQSSGTSTGFTNPLAVQLQDALGNVVPTSSVPVTFAPTAGCASVAGSPVNTDNTGTATVTVSAGAGANADCQIVAASTGLTSVTFDEAITGATGVPFTVTFLSPAGLITLPANTSGSDLKVQVLNAAGGPVAGATVSFAYAAGNTASPTAITLPSPDGCSTDSGVTDASGILDCGSIAANATPGMAQFTATAGNAGAISPVITVTAAALAPTLTMSFSPATVTSGQPTTLTFTITNPNTDAGDTLGGISFSDPLLGDLNADDVRSIVLGDGTVGSCPTGTGLSDSGTPNPATASVSLTIPTLAPGASCTATVIVTYTLNPTATVQAHTLTNTTSAGAFTSGGDVKGKGTFPAATTHVALVPNYPDHLVIISGDNQVTPATAPYACPLVVQVQDAANNPVLTPEQMVFTIQYEPGNGAGASFTSVGTGPIYLPPTVIMPYPPDITTGATFFTIPAGCANAGKKYQGVGVVGPGQAITLFANQFPSLYVQYMIGAFLPDWVHPAVYLEMPFHEVNSQQLGGSCGVSIDILRLLGFGGTQLRIAIALGNPVGNDLALRGPGDLRLLALPIPSSLTCLLPYDFAGPPAVRLPTQVDFNATVVSSRASGFAEQSTIHVTIMKDVGANPPVESVTITNLAGTTTYYSFTLGNTFVQPRTFVIRLRRVSTREGDGGSPGGE